MRQLKRRLIIVIIVLSLAGALIFVRTMRLYKSVAPNQSIATEETIADSEFTTFCKEYEKKWGELNKQEFSSWFDHWQRKLIGRFVVIEAIFRGSIPIMDNASKPSGLTTLIFRPQDGKLRHLLRINFSVAGNNEFLQSLTVNDSVSLRGKIKELKGETTRLNTETLPFGSLLTVVLEEVNLTPLNE